MRAQKPIQDLPADPLSGNVALNAIPVEIAAAN